MRLKAPLTYAAYLSLLPILLLLVSVWRPSSLRKPYAILLVGDFSRNRDFAPQVLEAFELNSQRVDNPLDGVELLKIDDEGDTGGFRLRERVLKTLSHKRVLVIVCASTSAVAQHLTPVSRSLNIPTLFVVATNDRLLAPPSKNLIRLIPNDRRQATSFTAWIESHASGSLGGPVAVFHSSDVYGSELARRIAVSSPSALTFPLQGAHTNGSMVQCFNILKIRAYCFIGYSHESLSALKMLRMLRESDPSKPNVLVILSDGSAQALSSPSDYEGLKVYLSTPLPSSNQNKAARKDSFAEIAKEAWDIIAYSHKKSVGDMTARFDETLRTTLERDPAKRPPDTANLPVIDGKTGERIDRGFSIEEIGQVAEGQR